jgi:hypothetical protein
MQALRSGQPFAHPHNVADPQGMPIGFLKDLLPEMSAVIFYVSARLEARRMAQGGGDGSGQNRSLGKQGET